MRDAIVAINSFNQIVHLLRDNYVFRGMRDVRFRLEPSVARNAPTNAENALLREEGFIRNFKKYAVGTPIDFRTQASHWDWLALAQHHGAPTRLLDWTWSPLVALYFSMWRATEEELTSLNASIWCVDPYVALTTNADPIFRKWAESYLRRGFGPYNLHSNKLSQMEAEYDGMVPPLRPKKEGPLAVHSWFIHDVLRGVDANGDRLVEDLLFFVELPSSNPRLVAQSGLFAFMSGPARDMATVVQDRVLDAQRPLWTEIPSNLVLSSSTLDLVLGDPAIEDNFELLEKVLRDTQHRPLAVRITIPAFMHPGTGDVPARVALSNWLSKMRINDRTMFPDLDGLGSFVRTLYDDRAAESGFAWP